MRAMKNYFPIAAVDIETAKYYKPEDMNKMKLEQLLANNKLSDIVTLAIVWIDTDLVIHKESYTFKPTTPIDPKATELHGLDDEFFKSKSKLYKSFLKKDANEINEILRGMKQVYAHNQVFDYAHI